MTALAVLGIVIVLIAAAAGAPGSVILLGLLAFAIYLLPAIIASNRKHHNAGAILALNLLLGWTFLGWAAAFVWACTAVQPRVSAPS